jgi:FK506-binding protein 1
MSQPHPNPKSHAVIEADPENANIIKVTNPNKPGHVIVTIKEEGEGDRPISGQMVSMEYTGYLKDESRPNGRSEDSFDSTNNPGRGAFDVEIGIGRVIGGWDEGVPLLRPGGSAELEISP